MNVGHYIEENTHMVVIPARKMVPLLRKSGETFIQMIKRHANNYSVIVNASYIDLTRAVQARAYSGMLVDPSDAIPNGLVISDGKVIAGNASKGDGRASFYYQPNQDRELRGRGGKYGVLLSNAPSSATSGISGVVPAYISGLRFGVENIWQSNTPEHIEKKSVGAVPSAHYQYLIQKSNAMFTEISQDSVLGKTAIGYSVGTDQLLIMVQQHGVKGKTAEVMRETFVANHVGQAVFFDCSDSATLCYNGKILVSPGNAKDNYLTVAVGFE